MAGAGVLMLPLPAAAQQAVAAAAAESAAGSIASSIGSKLASGMAGAVASAALGQVLKLAGLDMDGQAAVLAKLDEILQRLDAIEFQVKSFRASMDKQLSKLDYNVTHQSIEPLINLNAGLRRHFNSLAHTSADKLPQAKESIRALFGSLRLDLAPETWHDALVGAGGQTGLIEAWAAAVYANHADWYGEDAARKVQRQWDYLDGQQALSVNYLIEHYNDQGLTELARDTLAQWHENRVQQVRLLRGMLRDSLAWRAIDRAGQVIEGRFALNHLPEHIAISPATRIMWLIVISTPVRMDRSKAAFQQEVDRYAATAFALTGVGGDEAPPANRWRLYDSPAILQLLKDCGGTVGGRASDPDIFAQALRNHGFSTYNDQRLWTANDFQMPAPIPIYGRTAFVEGQSWWHYQRDPDATASLLLGRDLAPGEDAHYWYVPDA
jgi:hypothetical protein